MAIEDLPILKEEEIDKDTSIVDRAEICYKPWPGPNGHVLLTRVYFVLGKKEDGGIFITDYLHTDEDVDGWKCIGSYDTEKRYRIISDIKNYTSLIPTNEKK